jgi:hypothetical protein
MGKSLRIVMADLMNEFLCRIQEKKMWKTEEIEYEFHKSMYMIALDYVDENKKSL